MYSNEKVKPSYDKFTAYLKKHIKELKSQLEDYEKKANYSEVISELRDNPSLDMILKERESLISLNPLFDSQFKLIDFFVMRNASEAPQVTSTIRSILESDEVKNFDTKVSSSFNVSAIREELEQYTSLLNGVNLDIDFLVSVLDKSTLTEEEKLDVLSKNAFDRIPVKKIDESLKEEKEKSIEEEMTIKVNETTPQEEMVDISKLNDRFMISMPVIDDIKKTYSYLVKNKNDKQLAYASSIFRLFDFGELSPEEAINYSNEIVMSLYLEIINYSKEISGLIEKAVDGKLSVSDSQYLELCITDEENYIMQFSSLVKMKEEEKKKEEETKTDEDKKLLFLADGRGKCLLDFTGFKSTEVETLFDKCRRGLKRKEYRLGPGSNFSVIMNNVSKTACSYVTLSDRFNLVIDVSHIGEAHDRAIGIATRNQEVINDYIELATSEPEELYDEQEGIRKSIEEKLNIPMEGDKVTL